MHNVRFDMPDSPISNFGNEMCQMLSHMSLSEIRPKTLCLPKIPSILIYKDL